MTLRDLRERFKDDGWDYPGVPSEAFPEGKTYHVASPDALTGAWLTATSELVHRVQAGYQPTAEELESLSRDDEEEKQFYQSLLGPTYDEMIADKVTWQNLKMVALDAFACVTRDERFADLLIAAAVGEAAARPNRATRRTAKKTAGSSSRRASTPTRARTRKQGSTPAPTRSSTSPNEPGAETVAEAI